MIKPLDIREQYRPGDLVEVPASPPWVGQVVQEYQVCLTEEEGPVEVVLEVKGSAGDYHTVWLKARNDNG